MEKNIFFFFKKAIGNASCKSTEEMKDHYFNPKWQFYIPNEKKP